MSFGDRERLEKLTASQFSLLVYHRERAAVAGQVTGSHCVPGFLDLDKMGAGDTDSSQ